MQAQQTNVPATEETGVTESLLALITKGDLGKLTPSQLLDYYAAVCKSLRLNPLTRPFEFLQLTDRRSKQTRTVMYATRTCTDQLRKLHEISIEVIEAKADGDIYIVRVRGRTPEGRIDENIGAVPLVFSYTDQAGNVHSRSLSPSERANAIMTAYTKAARRLTLSMCGLGIMSEDEAQSLVHDGLAQPAMPQASAPQASAPQASVTPQATETPQEAAGAEAELPPPAEPQASAPAQASPQATPPATPPHSNGQSTRRRDIPPAVEQKVRQIRAAVNEQFDGDTPFAKWQNFCGWARTVSPQLPKLGLEHLPEEELDKIIEELKALDIA